MPRTAIQHKSSTLGEKLMNTATQSKRGRQLAATSSFESGEGGIRTPERLASLPVFKTGAIDRSATSPKVRRRFVDATTWFRFLLERFMLANAPA
jgi:hypothetical protein